MNGHIVDLIGRLDRVLSELLIASERACDEADIQTIKHHADDCIGVGQKVLANLKERGVIG